MTSPVKSKTDETVSAAEVASLPGREIVAQKIETLREREIVLADQHTKTGSDLNAVRAKIDAWIRFEDALLITEEVEEKNGE